MARKASENKSNDIPITKLKVGDVNALRKASVEYPYVTVKMGSRSFKIPVVGRMLQSDEKGLFTFINIPAFTSVMGITSEGTEMIKESELPNAIKALKSAARAGTPKKGRTGAATVAMPEDLQKQLEAFAKANNVRVVIDPKTGAPKIQKLRAARAKK